MASVYTFRPLLSVGHSPTVLLAIGYSVFWLELYWVDLSEGRTSWLASGAFLFFVLAAFFCERKTIQKLIVDFLAFFRDQALLDRFLVVAGVILGGATLYWGLRAALFPPHLPQEFDALNYHITLPRQHLILESFVHIPWSLADLYLLPVDFALAPYWLATELPNKWPQYVFFAGLLWILAGWAYRVSNDWKSVIFVICGFLGTHVIGIQIGTAMLDVVLCYLFVAALDSLKKGHFVLAGLEASFYFCGKSFLPLQIILIAVCLAVSCAVFIRFAGFALCWQKADDLNVQDFRDRWPHLMASFLLAGVLIGGPFVAKSVYYAGTPLYPFAPGIVKPVKNYEQNPVHWQSIKDKAARALENRDAYGSGRSIKDFIVHLWMIAVPEKGVNNRYDYPVGLVYLLCVLPFGMMVGQSLRQRTYPFLIWLVIFYWAVWWLGSHQTRFLYVPLVLMMLSVLMEPSLQNRLLLGFLLLAMVSVSVSVFRANKGIFYKSGHEVLREKDKYLLEMTRHYAGDGEAVELDYYDAAYAGFPVTVKGDESVFVLRY